ncbi:MAG: 3'-5' exonuclease, partial [Candidatus Hydrogenedentes bacterium]|nr:3'-5' exonuclease [Candidatus Hydrogenedentota bacterium]
RGHVGVKTMDWTELADWVEQVTESDLPKPPIALAPAIRIEDVGRCLAALRDEVAKGADTARARTGALQREISRLMELGKAGPDQEPADTGETRKAAELIGEENLVQSVAEPGSLIVAFDFETTGLYPHESDIVEVGGVKFTPMGEVIDRFERFANPGYPIPPESMSVSGITTEMVAGAEPPLAVLEAFIAWAGPQTVYVAHNAPFDAGFIEATYLKAHKECPPLQIVDTLEWARSLELKTRNYKLATLLAYYQKSTEGLHRSMADAQGVMELVLQFVTGHLTPFEEILRWAKPLPLPPSSRR